ncbi:hypothetical protein [Bacillus sp. FJAT-22090]|uniref:hypothetical protein n=1 Tax=Bacillus sp. FJAT-22090 TaxID=1581038 RepID=UPI00119ED3E7|nr:hypothetical protein [Bacillus sp. FJAT-22090]
MMEERKLKPVTVVEIVLTYISLGWAYVLFTSPNLFETSSNWMIIGEIASYEWLLGVIALACALVKIVGIVLQHKRIRWVGLVMSTVFWIVIATGFLISAGHISLTTGFIVYSGIAVMSLWTSKEVLSDE